MKNFFSIAILVIMMTSAVAVAQESVMTTWVYFDLGSTVIPDSARPALDNIRAKIDSAGWDVRLYADADSTKWVGEGKKKSLAVDGGVIIVRCQPVARYLGLQSFVPRVLTGHNRRAVLVVATPPGTAREYADAAALAALGKKVDALDTRVSDLERAEMMRKLREALAEDTRWVRFGLGISGVGVSFPKNQQASFVTPVTQFDFRLGQRFTAHAIGGVIKTHATPDLYGGLFTATLGCRVWKSFELNAGYTLASEFDSKFFWETPGGWRVDAPIFGLALNIGLGHGIKIHPHVSTLYAGDKTWGVVGGTTIVF